MKNLILSVVYLVTVSLYSQTISLPEYTISEIKIIPYDSKTGEFQQPLKLNLSEPFNNAISISLFLVVEVTGKARTFEPKRKVEIQVTEGKKKKLQKVEKNMLIGEKGKYYIPILLEPLMCDTITISAKILGQTQTASLTRQIPFKCGG